MALLHRLRRDETPTDETPFARTPQAAALAPATRTTRQAPRHPAPGPRPRAATRTITAASRVGGPLPPSVARVAARTRLSAELLAAILEVDARQRATLDDIERADALAERLLARRADRQRAAAGAPSWPGAGSDIRLAG
jgi:hypothetical protein